MDDESPKRRQREPRVRDNPMARIAHDVMVEAERALRRADALAAEMEPHLLKRLNNSAIYGYTNDRADRNVPPGDVLLAAALAAGISLDQKLGMARATRAAEMDDLRIQLAELRAEVANMRVELNDGSRRPGAAAEASDEAVNARGAREAQRRAWARGSAAGAPPSSPAPGAGRGSRTIRP